MTIAIKPTATTATIEHNDSTILTVDSSGNITPSNDLYPKVPVFSAFKNGSNQSVSNTTNTKITFNDEEFDTTSDYDTTNSRFTPSVAGYYNFNTQTHIDSANSTGKVEVKLFKNGSFYSYIDVKDDASPNFSAGGADLAYANGSTDYFEIYVYHNFGSARNILQYTSKLTTFQAHLVSV
jgi:hypothetical protein